MRETTLLQIRGISSTGKTTCMKSFIAHHGLKPGRLGTMPYYIGGRWCVLGDYSKSGCCGPDLIRGSDVIFNGLLMLRDAFQPEWLLFEHMLLSTTYRFASTLRKSFGGLYGAIFMNADFKDVVRRLAERNGGKRSTKYDVLLGNYVAAKKTALKLAWAGVAVERVNPFEHKPDRMHEIVDNFIEKYEKGGFGDAGFSCGDSEILMVRKKTR